MLPVVVQGPLGFRDLGQGIATHILQAEPTTCFCKLTVVGHNACVFVCVDQRTPSCGGTYSLSNLFFS